MSEDKKTLYVNGIEVEFDKEPNLLEVIRKAGFEVPTFCYRPDLTQFGACRMCVFSRSDGTKPSEIYCQTETVGI